MREIKLVLYRLSELEPSHESSILVRLKDELILRPCLMGFLGEGIISSLVEGDTIDKDQIVEWTYNLFKL